MNYRDHAKMVNFTDLPGRRAPPTWYAKNTDPGALYCASFVDAGLYESIGSYIHANDMPDVLVALGLEIIPPELFQPCADPALFWRTERDILRKMSRDQVLQFHPGLVEQWERLQ